MPGRTAPQPALCRLIDIASEDQIPKPWNLSRFLDAPRPRAPPDRPPAVFDDPGPPPGLAVPDLGQHTAGDATRSPARAKTRCQGRPPRTPAGAAAADGRQEGVHRRAGPGGQVVEWFGYKLHLLVDVSHEVALAYDISDTKAGDNERVPALVEQARPTCRRAACRRWPTTRRPTTRRSMRRCTRPASSRDPEPGVVEGGEPRGPARGAATRCTWSMTRRARSSCYDTVSEPAGAAPMAYIGYEQERETVKYRCPARHEGWDCPSDERSATRARTTAWRYASPVRWTCGGSRRSRGRRRNSSGATRAGRRRAGERPAEDLLGGRRRQRYGGGAVPCLRGGGAGGPFGVRHAAGQGPALGRHAGARRGWEPVAKAASQAPAAFFCRLTSQPALPGRRAVARFGCQRGQPSRLASNRVTNRPGYRPAHRSS